jgi:hypothetical protein
MKRLYSLLFLLVLVFGFHQEAKALTVSPPILEIAGDPGATISGSIKLFNERNTAETFFTSFENFEPSDDAGTPKFVGAQDGLATWLSTTGSVTLAPQERIEVPFTLDIPADVDPGGYFAAIFFGAQPPVAEGGVVSIGGRLGVLTLLRVNGDIPEEGGVLSYNTVESRKFYTIPPVQFEYRFSNDGGDRVVPRGDIEIKNTFGKVRDIINANISEGSVLPDSARRFKPFWNPDATKPDGFVETVKYQWKNFHVGFYTAEMNLGWGFTNQVANESISFMIFPWQLILVLLLSLFILFFVFKLGSRAYKKSLMRQFEKMKQEQEQE